MNGYAYMNVLTEIPTDPFDGEPIRDSRERKILYSVGVDFKDKGGSELPSEHELKGDGSSAEGDQSDPTFPLRFVM